VDFLSVYHMQGTILSILPELIYFYLH
jgi:hypothetical protein